MIFFSALIVWLPSLTHNRHVFRRRAAVAAYLVAVQKSCLDVCPKLEQFGRCRRPVEPTRGQRRSTRRVRQMFYFVAGE